MQSAAELYKNTEASLFIETVSGRNFHIDRPEFHVEEIAHALSMQCRYTGHTREFYSVAEHAMLVARIMQHLNLGLPFEGLMHDAAEAYLSDIAAPWKALLPDYKILEQKIEVPLRRHYGLTDKITDGCKYADWIALFIEAHNLIPSRGRDFTAPPGIKEHAEALSNKFPLECYPPKEARQAFLAMFYNLLPKI